MLFVSRWVNIVLTMGHITMIKKENYKYIFMLADAASFYINGIFDVDGHTCK